ncbi:hypothetical protein [Kitasatospora griseola]|uniref:hypothetical protein n=1 Tax=Kitasatospora griseola TaxID=2064 RepID=UPI00382229C6
MRNRALDHLRDERLEVRRLATPQSSATMFQVSGSRPYYGQRRPKVVGAAPARVGCQAVSGR